MMGANQELIMTTPFDGLRILDLSTEIAGPFATRLLADTGAEIIKVESPDGDPLRRMKTSSVLGLSEPLAAGEDGALFQWLNASKQSVVLDLETDSGRASLRAIYAEVDVVIENFEPGWLASQDLGLEAIQRANPKASLVSISPYGQDGPWSHRPATEFTLQAESGSLSGRGYPDLGPVYAGGRLGEFSTGSFAAVAAISAWTMGRRAGTGQHADVSMLETMLLCFQPYQYIQGQMQPGGQMPVMVEVPSIEPAGDGMVGFSTQTSQQWQDLCVLVEHPEWVTDESLCLGFERFMRREELLGPIQEWTRGRSVDEIVDLCGQLRIPVAPIGNGETVLRTDHMVERDFYRDHPAGFKVPGVPFKLEKGDLSPLEPAPALGADTERVLAAIGTPRREAQPNDSLGPAEKPLAGLRVVDFTAFWAGPFAATVLATLGAEVIKVESIQRPDGMRFASGFIPEDGIVWEWAPVFHGANSGKQAITLNLDTDEGLGLAKDLVRQADVVIENFSPRVMERFGLDGPGVEALNPEAILVRMPAFGLSGPWRDRVGFAMTIEQASGLAWVTGFPEREPVVPRGVCDPVGGMTAVFALLAALEKRGHGAGGQQVEVALLEVGLTLAGEQVIEQSAYGVRIDRAGNVGPVSAPQGVYPCIDERNPESVGWVAIAVASDEEWAALVCAMGDPSWASSAALQTEMGRRAAAEEIDQGLRDFCRNRQAKELAETLATAGVPVGWLHNQRNVVPGHTQLDKREFLAFLDHPYAGKIGYPKLSIRFDGEYAERTLPPLLGESNERVLSEVLGLSAKEIESLTEKQVIGARPSFL
jgi:crotonobetainyl-CoA:carnitine CoA-transferase CaiB-like acyl-CoA transferase